MSDNRVEHVAAPALEHLIARAFNGCGVSEDHARRTAMILTLADLMGIHTHGAIKVMDYAERIAVGGMAAAPEVGAIALAPALTLVDGGNGLGPAVAHIALEHAMTAAAAQGIAASFVRAGNHFGAAAPYAHMAAERGFASLIFTNAPPLMAPWGAAETLLGNNPIGIGVPRPGGAHAILDIATSVASRSKIRQAQREGRAIPADWALDADGKATTIAEAALAGALRPFAEHKGSGLAVMADLLAGVLGGAGFLTSVMPWLTPPGPMQNLGHLFILLDTAKLGTGDWLAERMEAFVATLHAARPAEPGRRVGYPGERSGERLRLRLRDGFEMPSNLLRSLEALAARS